MMDARYMRSFLVVACPLFGFNYGCTVTLHSSVERLIFERCPSNVARYQCLCASLVLAENESEAHFRHKRNALQLCDIINRYTGRFCLSYNNYGCFCGLRSVGSSPLDDADRCCQTHDRCFAALPCQHLPLLTYSMRCSGSSCTCNNQNRDSCQYRSCQCDVQFGECLRGTSYNRSYRNYRTHQCV